MVFPSRPGTPLARNVRTGPDGVPSLSFRQLLADEMRPSVCFHPAGLLAPLRDCVLHAFAASSPPPQAVPFALAIPWDRVSRCQGRDSDCEAFAADDGPSTADSTLPCAGSAGERPPQTTLSGHPWGCDSQTRRVKPTSPIPPLTDAPAFRQAALGLGNRLPFCSPFGAITVGMFHPVPEGAG